MHLRVSGSERLAASGRLGFFTICENFSSRGDAERDPGGAEGPTAESAAATAKGPEHVWVARRQDPSKKS